MLDPSGITLLPLKRRGASCSHFHPTKRGDEDVGSLVSLLWNKVATVRLGPEKQILRVILFVVVLEM